MAGSKKITKPLPITSRKIQKIAKIGKEKPLTPEQTQELASSVVAYNERDKPFEPSKEWNRWQNRTTTKKLTFDD